MMNLQFLADSAIAPEDLAGIKGGKRTESLRVSAAAEAYINKKLGTSISKSVLYNGRVVTMSRAPISNAVMVTAHNKDTCVEW